MYTLLVVALLLALLFDLAAATSPSMDPMLPANPMEPFYNDPEGLLGAVCDLCGISLDYCVHALTNPRHRAPTFTEETFYLHPEWCQLDDLDEPEPEPQRPYYPDPEYVVRQPLADEVIRQLNDNATNVRSSTVQEHVEDIYTPGDRLRVGMNSRSRRPSHRRQAPRPGGFPCTVDGCGKLFDRSCDLKRHQKTHLGRSERPHKCTVCDEGFLYPKDRERHQRTHEQSTSSRSLLFCPVPGCANVDGFSRRDNLLRHQRKQHPQPIATS